MSHGTQTEMDREKVEKKARESGNEKREMKIPEDVEEFNGGRGQVHDDV